MGGSQKSKRVTWASDVNLCQVRLFLSEESPSEVGMGTQDHLQAKAAWPVQSGGDAPDDNLPPGFEGIQPGNLWRVKLSQIPLMKWRCPPRFEINSEWQVVAGDESKEMEAQSHREMRVLEAIYPRPSAIPPNPSASADVEDSTSNDQNIPLVPVTPIEDDDASLDASFGSLTANSIPMISKPQHLFNGTFSSPAVEGDIVAAAQAALTSVMSNSDQGNLIDRDLLIRILSNPKMVEQLVTSHGASSITQNGPSPSLQNMPSSSFQNMPVAGLQTATSSTTHISSSSSNIHNMSSSSLQSMPAIVHLQKHTPFTTQNMPSTSTPYIPNLKLPPKNSFDPTNIAISRIEPLSAQISRPEFNISSTASSTAPFHPPQLRTGSMPNPWPSAAGLSSSPSTSLQAPVTKDINYYKSLIQQHGGERRDALPQSAAAQSNSQSMVTGQEPLNFMKSRESRSRIMKPCIYFNSSRGCRNGANCAYQHDMSSQKRVNGVTEFQSVKRVKLDREISDT